MAIPETAYAVQYTVRYYNGDDPHPGEPIIEFDTTFEALLPAPDSSPEMRVLTDQALAAAALAFSQTVESAYPDVPGAVGRTYLCREQGDPWPPSPVTT